MIVQRRRARAPKPIVGGGRGRAGWTLANVAPSGRWGSARSRSNRCGRTVMMSPCARRGRRPRRRARGEARAATVPRSRPGRDGRASRGLKEAVGFFRPETISGRRRGAVRERGELAHPALAKGSQSRWVGSACATGPGKALLWGDPCDHLDARRPHARALWSVSGRSRGADGDRPRKCRCRRRQLEPSCIPTR